MTVIVDLGQDVKELTPRMIALRRELHRHPELAFEEVWTAATLAERMRALGLVVQDGIVGTGVLAVLEGAKSGKTLLIRADMDAVPMEETSNREYASTIEGRNHCWPRRALGHRLRDRGSPGASSSAHRWPCGVPGNTTIVENSGYGDRDTQNSVIR